MVKRLAALLGIAIVAALGLAVPVAAADPIEITANKTPPFTVGQRVKFTVTGCDDKTKVDWELWSVSPSVKVMTQKSNSNAVGKDEWQINIPGPPGDYYVKATCESGGVSATDFYPFTVLPAAYPPGRPGPGLPEADGTWVPGVGGLFTATCDPPSEWVRFGVYPFNTANEVRSYTVYDNGDGDVNLAVGIVSVFINAWNNGAMYYVLYECGPEAVASSGAVAAESGSAGSGGQNGAVPVSGSDVQQILRVAIVLAAVGAGFAFVARRRRTATT